jgi:hypothetical protein
MAQLLLMEWFRKKWFLNLTVLLVKISSLAFKNVSKSLKEGQDLKCGLMLQMNHLHMIQNLCTVTNN